MLIGWRFGICPVNFSSGVFVFGWFAVVVCVVYCCYWLAGVVATGSLCLMFCVVIVWFCVLVLIYCGVCLF